MLTLREPGQRRKQLWIVALAGAVAFLVVLPLYRLQNLALEDGGEGYRSAFSRGGISEILEATALLAVGAVVLAMVFGTVLAWCATQLPPRLGFLRITPTIPLVMPAIASVIGWTFLLSPRPGYINAALRQLPWWDHLDAGPVDIYSLEWIVIITGFNLTAFVYVFVSSGLANINSELVEAARLSGSSSTGAFFKIVLPLMRPALVYGGAVSLLLGLGQFTTPLLLGGNSGVRVLTTEMYYHVSQSPINYAAAAAIGSPLLIFGVVVVVGQRWLLGNRDRFVTHGGKGFKNASKHSYLAVATMVLFTLVSTVVPTVALFIVAFSPFWGGTIDVASMSLDNFREVLALPSVTSAIWTSLVCSFAAMLIATFIGFCAALVLKVRRLGPTEHALDVLVALPLGVPSVVFGVGFLLAYTQGPIVLYGTRWVIILVYVTLMIPYAVRMQLTAMYAIGDAYVEASRAAGATAWRTNTRILLPLMRPAIGGSAALMFILLTHEFSASLLVRTPRTELMGTLVYYYYSSGSYPTVACITLIMTAITGVGVAVAMKVAGPDALQRQ